jgi:predicted O-methyltransferase YrrM
MNKILNLLNNPSNDYSLSLLKKIQSQIKERSFHLSGHIVYDLINMIPKDDIVYAEIGSYCGSSACLALSNNKTKEIFCIDPLNLPQSHYGGILNQEKTLIKNLSKIETDTSINIIKKFSNDRETLEIFNNKKIDLLYIDGDHTFPGVLADWRNFRDTINKGGFVIFDDYYDFEFSPGVKKAVDYIVSNNMFKSYEIIGCPDNVHNIKFKRKNNTDKNNSFIFYKKGNNNE